MGITRFQQRVLRLFASTFVSCCSMLFLCTITFIVVSVMLAEGRDLPHSYRFEASNMSFVAEYMTLPDTARSMSPTFLTDPPTEQLVSHSQAGQDLSILTYLNNKENGYFVDLAANHWSKFSNSYVAEQFHKWQGICIEPNPMYLKDLLSYRKCKVFTCAVGVTDGEKMTFRYHHGDNGVYGGIVGEGFDNTGTEAGTEDREITLVSLTTLLDFAGAPRVMDYLSLDVEGAEYQVVKGLDHSKYTFHVATVERPKANTHHVLARAGYRFFRQVTSWGETMYLHRSMPTYEKLMQEHRHTTVPRWHNVDMTYMVHPAWDAESGEKNQHEH